MTSKDQSYAVLIPSKSRPSTMLKLFRRCPSLNCKDTFVALEHRERSMYREWLNQFPEPQVVWIDNPKGLVSLAREALRVKATASSTYARYVLSDDDICYTDVALRALTESHRLFTEQYGECVVAGLSTIYKRFNRESVELLVRPVGAYHTYPGLSTVWWCVPDTLYNAFAYPDCEFDDIYLQLYAIRKGLVRWRVCVEARFEILIPRWGYGGLGSVSERVEKLGLAMAKIAHDFPEWMTPDSARFNFRLRELIDMEATRQQRRLQKGIHHG